MKRPDIAVIRQQCIQGILKPSRNDTLVLCDALEKALRLLRRLTAPLGGSRRAIPRLPGEGEAHEDAERFLAEFETED